MGQSSEPQCEFTQFHHEQHAGPYLCPICVPRRPRPPSLGPKFLLPCVYTYTHSSYAACQYLLRTAVYNSFFVTSINVHDPTVTVFNYTTGSLPTDGAMIMSVIQCTSTNCTKEAIDIVSLFVNFTDVPSVGFSSIGAAYELGFLVCKPNITIETREIRTQGSMTLGVQPLADGTPPYPRQGNLDWTQTSLLVAYSLSGLTSDSGPASSAWFGLGSGTQADFIFGSDQMNSIPSSVIYENTTMVLTPLPLDQLAQGYTQMVKASMKRMHVFIVPNLQLNDPRRYPIFSICLRLTWDLIRARSHSERSTDLCVFSVARHHIDSVNHPVAHDGSCCTFQTRERRPVQSHEHRCGPSRFRPSKGSQESESRRHNGKGTVSKAQEVVGE